MAELDGKTIAILATDGFEEDELIKPRDELRALGAEVHVVSPKGGTIRAWRHTDWGSDVSVDKTLDAVTFDSYDALILPGGQINPDKLRLVPEAVAFVQDFYETGRPVAAICHGPWMLIEAGVVKGLNMTSWPSLQTDITNAGAHWHDQEVVEDEGIITSRNPGDIPAFNAAIARALHEGRFGVRANG